jgi:hypothetical protein
MRFGKWRGVAITCALTATFAAGLCGRTASADLFHHTIPREVDAIDVHTGEAYMAPPVPYGHYAKPGCGSHIGTICGLVRGGLCGLGCKGAGCGDPGCGGGCGLGGLFHKNGCGGDGCGGDPSCGGGRGCGLGGLLHKNGCGGDGCGSDPCGACGGGGCGFCHGMGLLRKGCGSGLGGHGGHGGCGNGSTGCPTVCGSPQASIVSPQCSTASPQCGDPGCRLLTRHWHRKGRGCSGCGGMGCGICQSPGMPSGSLCGSCHGSGCGACGGRGLFGLGDPGRGGGCGACGGRGCGLCGGGGGGCGACGGRGCGLCRGGGLIKAGLGLPMGLVAKAFHVGEIKYFVGPGGPVPLTPGYVPYVVTTRSPRDYFAFPPFVDTQP